METRVLIIDDEKNIRMMLTKCLTAEGYGVTAANDGEQGIAEFQKGGYQIVLLDMKMPGLNGMEVLKRLKELDAGIPIIMMTAFGTIESAVEAMQLGAVDFLQKPFTPDTIRHEVQSVLDRAKLQPADTQDFMSCLQYAKKCITLKDYEQARKYLMKALSFNTDEPEVYNLLGVLREYQGSVRDAQKYYRMALCVDPTYRPASKNLERTAQFKYTAQGIQLGNEDQ